MATPKDTIRANAHISEDAALQRLLDTVNIDAVLRESITTRAVELVERIRADSDPGMMELFLGEYGLSSDEGVALMCLAEALLRVPDAETMDALIEDKIAPSEWDQHLGHSHSSLVNASTWALFITGKVLREDEMRLNALVNHDPEADRLDITGLSLQTSPMRIEGALSRLRSAARKRPRACYPSAPYQRRVRIHDSGSHRARTGCAA